MVTHQAERDDFAAAYQRPWAVSFFRLLLKDGPTAAIANCGAGEDEVLAELRANATFHDLHDRILAHRRWLTPGIPELLDAMRGKTMRWPGWDETMRLTEHGAIRTYCAGRIRLAGHDAVQHLAARLAQDVGGDTSRLQIRVLQELLHAVRFVCARRAGLSDQWLPRREVLSDPDIDPANLGVAAVCDVEVALRIQRYICRVAQRRSGSNSPVALITC